MNRKKTISIVIPVYNEMRTIGSILEVVRVWGKAKEVIVVDDGSTDKTAQVVKQFLPNVRLIRLIKNVGKSVAMKRGVKTALGEYILFLDGDLLGVTCSILDALVAPLEQSDPPAMIVGELSIGHRLSGQFKSFGGERVLRRSDVLSLLPKLDQVGYGVEVVLNMAFAKKRVEYVQLPFVSHLIKFEKWSLHDAISSYALEGLQVIPRHLLYIIGVFVYKLRSSR